MREKFRNPWVWVIGLFILGVLICINNHEGDEIVKSETYKTHIFSDPKIVDSPIKEKPKSKKFDSGYIVDFTDPVDDEEDDFEIELGTGDPDAEESYDFNRD